MRIPLPLFSKSTGSTPPEDPFTVLLINANQSAGTVVSQDDTGLRTLTNEGYNGVAQVSPPKTGLPAKFGANALQKSVDAFDLSNTSAFSNTFTEHTSDLDISTDKDFCVEFWVGFTAEVGTPTSREIFNLQNLVDPAWCAVVSYNRTLTLRVDESEVGDAEQIPLFTWSHIALNRRGTIYSLYVDGLRVAGINAAAPGGGTEYRAVFRSQLEDQPIFDAMRICVGGAIYYDAFDVPTSEPEIINSDPLIGGRVVFLSNAENGAPGSRPTVDDLGNSIETGTGDGNSGSTSFGPQLATGGKFGQCWEGDSVSVGEFPNFPRAVLYTNPGKWATSIMGTTNYCVESWAQAGSTGDGPYVHIAYNVFDETWRGPGAIATGFRIFTDNSNDVIARVYRPDNVFTDSVQTGSVVAADWNHVAVAVADGIGTLYVNGVSVTTWGAAFISTNPNPFKPAILMVPSSKTEQGRVDGMRITLGSPVYTANFPVPVAPPTTSIP